MAGCLLQAWRAGESPSKPRSGKMGQGHRPAAFLPGQPQAGLDSDRSEV